MSEITLTKDQETAYAAMVDLLTAPNNKLVLLGGAGTGKTTLVKTFLKEMDLLAQLNNSAIPKYDVYLTATTNKAADALAEATGLETSTIHSLLGLRVVSTGYRQSVLKDNGAEVPPNALIIIDESSFIDDDLLRIVNKKTKNAKVIFLGDHCQLKPVGSDTTPVFSAGYPTVQLTQIVRQADTSPIKTLSLGLRAHVDGADMPNALVDGVNILHMDQAAFNQALVNECKQRSGTVRALAWTNKVAIYYNQLVAENLTGNSDFVLGDCVTVNRQVVLPNKFKLATDSTFVVTGLGAWKKDSYGLEARQVVTHFGITVMQARYQSEVEQAVKAAYDDKDYTLATTLENRYVDLRLMYASTVNKSQGSTYDTVYIDLADIGKCSDRDQVKRMLYVAVSRARSKVVFTGDI